MIIKAKNILGNIKRGLNGLIQNKLEKVPSIPSSLDSFCIGESFNNQKINCYQIGDGTIKILYVSCIHGNEVGTVKLANHLINWLNYEKDQLKEYTIYVVPCLNPDGYEKACKNPDYFKGGKVGRFNSNNVDLNRNFDTPSFNQESVWSFGKNYSKRKKVFCGKFANSEPETKILTDFILRGKIKIVFAFHNSGCDVVGSDTELSQKIAEIYSKKAGFRKIDRHEWVQLRQTGTAKEWCELHNIDYVEIEGSTRWGSDWNRQKKSIKATLDFIRQNY